MADQAMKEVETKSGIVFLTEQIRTLGYSKPQAETLLAMALEYTRGGLRPDQWNTARAQRINFSDIEVLGRTLDFNGLKSMKQLQGNMRGRMEDEKQLDADVRNAWDSAQPMSGPVSASTKQTIPTETLAQPQREARAPAGEKKQGMSEEQRRRLSDELAQLGQATSEALSSSKKKGGAVVFEPETIQPPRTHVPKPPSMRMAEKKPSEEKVPEPRLALTAHARKEPKPEEEEKPKFYVREAYEARHYEPTTAGKVSDVGLAPGGTHKTKKEYAEAAEAMLKFGTKPSELPPRETREPVYEIRVYASEGPNKEYLGTLRIPYSRLIDVLQAREKGDVMMPGSLTKKEEDRIYAINQGLILEKKYFPLDILNSQPSGAGGKTLAQLLDMPTVKFTFVAVK